MSRRDPFFDAFVDVEHIGSGYFGNVYKATQSDSTCVALKMVNSGPRADHEAQLSTQLSHSNIITTYSTHTLEDGAVVLVQEFAEGGDLFEYIERTGFNGTEAQLKDIFSQFAKAVQYLHVDKRICHRDIKPENCVLMKDGTVKLIDFGLSERGRSVKHNCGTDIYSAPEVIAQPLRSERRKSKKFDGFAADIFSLGITLHAMLMGELPWERADRSSDRYAAFIERLVVHHISGAVFTCNPIDLGISPHLSNLLDSMLHPNPRHRPTIDQVLKSIDDGPWLVPTAARILCRNSTLSKSVANANHAANEYVLANKDSGIGSCSDVSKVRWSDLEEEDEDQELPPIPSFLIAPILAC